MYSIGSTPGRLFQIFTDVSKSLKFFFFFFFLALVNKCHSTIRVMFLNCVSSLVPLVRVLYGSLKPYMCYAVNLPVTEQ